MLRWQAANIRSRVGPSKSVILCRTSSSPSRTCLIASSAARRVSVLHWARVSRCIKAREGCTKTTAGSTPQSLTGRLQTVCPCMSLLCFTCTLSQKCLQALDLEQGLGNNGPKSAEQPRFRTNDTTVPSSSSTAERFQPPSARRSAAGLTPNAGGSQITQVFGFDGLILRLLGCNFFAEITSSCARQQSSMEAVGFQVSCRFGMEKVELWYFWLGVINSSAPSLCLKSCADLWSTLS